jgi:hypothetical protein
MGPGGRTSAWWDRCCARGRSHDPVRAQSRCARHSEGSWAEYLISRIAMTRFEFASNGPVNDTNSDSARKIVMSPGRPWRAGETTAGPEEPTTERLMDCNAASGTGWHHTANRPKPESGANRSQIFVPERGGLIDKPRARITGGTYDRDLRRGLPGHARLGVSQVGCNTHENQKETNRALQTSVHGCPRRNPCAEESTSPPGQWAPGDRFLKPIKS